MTKIISTILLVAVAFLASSGAEAQYWKVTGNPSNVWSLSEDNFVAIDNSTYLAWVDAGNLANTIASTSELYDVIEASYASHLAVSAPVLEANGGLSPIQSFTWRKVNGLDIVYTGAEPLNGRYSIDDQWLGGLMTGALLRCGATVLDSCSIGLPGGASTYVYLDKTFAPHEMSVTQMKVISLAIEDHVATLYEQLKIGLDGGTPSWPSLTKTVP